MSFQRNKNSEKVHAEVLKIIANQEGLELITDPFNTTYNPGKIHQRFRDINKACLIDNRQTFDCFRHQKMLETLAATRETLRNITFSSLP